MNTSLKAFFPTKASLTNYQSFSLKELLTLKLKIPTSQSSQYLTSNQGLTGWILFVGILIYMRKGLN